MVAALTGRTSDKKPENKETTNNLMFKGFIKG
jgi:hypothetical protein